MLLTHVPCMIHSTCQMPSCVTVARVLVTHPVFVQLVIPAFFLLTAWGSSLKSRKGLGALQALFSSS